MRKEGEKKEKKKDQDESAIVTKLNRHTEDDCL